MGLALMKNLFMEEVTRACAVFLWVQRAPRGTGMLEDHVPRRVESGSPTHKPGAALYFSGGAGPGPAVLGLIPASALLAGSGTGVKPGQV